MWVDRPERVGSVRRRPGAVPEPDAANVIAAVITAPAAAAVAEAGRSAIVAAWVSAKGRSFPA